MKKSNKSINYAPTAPEVQINVDAITIEKQENITVIKGKSVEVTVLTKPYQKIHMTNHSSRQPSSAAYLGIRFLK